MKLWEEKDKKRNEIIDQFTVGKDRYYDTLLAKYDCKASIAHSKMLAKVNILSKKESDKLNKVLNEIIDEIKKGEFKIEDEFEDMHSKIEFVLIQKLHFVSSRPMVLQNKKTTRFPLNNTITTGGRGTWRRADANAAAMVNMGFGYLPA